MAGNGIYVTAAFKSVRENQAIIFMQKEYVVDDYAPGKKYDTILSGPDFIGNGFSSLKGTVFAERGIDCAFASTQDAGVAYIFSGNQCAKWFYDPIVGNNKILEGPKPIADMFHFFKGTVFEGGVDAAFESTIPGEAYLFKGFQYARINYATQSRLISCYPIREKWPCFRGTMFEYGFDAAFATHEPNKAYIFKGENYAKIKFTPNEANDEMLWSGRIIDSWSGLGSILPRKNCNLVAN